MQQSINEQTIQKLKANQKNKKKIQKYKWIKKKYQFQNKIPIWLIVSYLPPQERQRAIVTDPNQTFIQFTQGVKAKLLYDRQMSKRGCFFNVIQANQSGKIIHRHTISNTMKQMGQLFEKYKTNLGWIQIQIQQESIFG